MSTLYLITARGGSKRLPGKNTRILGDKSLLAYSIDIARKFSSDEDICLSTDSTEIMSTAAACNLKVPFLRPPALASDTAGSREVVLHALDFYKAKGIHYNKVILLQPTSPFRKGQQISDMLNLYSSSLDMVVSVKESYYSPYFSLFEEDTSGNLHTSKPGISRQDSPNIYAYNGSVYVINANSLYKSNFDQFRNVRKYVMDEIHSIDIDTQFDWWIAEKIVEKSLWSGF